MKLSKDETKTFFLICFCSASISCASDKDGVGGGTGGAPATYDFPLDRTSCAFYGDTSNCYDSAPRCAASSTKCLPTSGTFPYSCAYTPLLAPATSCKCYEGEETLCYTSAGKIGTQLCIMDSDTSSHLSATCTPISQ